MIDKEEANLPLKDIRVLDLTRLIPGGYCTSILGDVGAEVVKVEEPNIGDYEREIQPFIGSTASRFLILNRNKKSIVLNLKEDRGRELFLRLAETADVLVEGFRPGAMAKLGLDYESIRKVNPKLIYCSISSFGQNGPYRDVVAHDINILGLCGFLDITGTDEGKTVIPGVQISDFIAGTNAALSILIALISRRSTNVGQFLDVSMFDGMMAWMIDAARYAFAGHAVPEKNKGRLWGGFPNYNIYKTKEGKFITIGSLENKFKRILLEKLGGKEFLGTEEGATSSAFNDSDGELQSFLQETFLTKTVDEWMAELGPLNICVVPVSSVEEAVAHPQAISRSMVVDVEHPLEGTIKQIGSALKFSNIPIDVNRVPAPRLGEHTKEILNSLGYSEEEIEEMTTNSIVQ